MKRAGLFTIILFLTAIIYSSCKEDIYMDWKLRNDRWYTTLEDSITKDTLHIFHKTSSGLYYKVLGQGNERYPNGGDWVIMRRTGTLIDGSAFDALDTIGTYLTTSYVPQGLVEGISLMQNGGHYIFYLPSSIGYDTITTNSSIPPYSVLKYDIRLLKSY